MRGLHFILAYPAMRFIRARDLAWPLLFSAIAAVGPFHTTEVVSLLLCLAVLQVLEPRIPYFSTKQGSVLMMLVKIGLCYLVMGWTDGINSSYYVILLLPVVSAATTLNLIGTAGITLLACGAYVSLLLFLDWGHWEFTVQGAGELGLRVIFLPVVAFLTHSLVEQNRVEAKRYQAVAEQLRKANEDLQEAEAAVRRSDRLAALGQLTAGLAHELRNPLGTMRASAEILARNTSSENEITREMAGFIATEVDRVNSLITRFLDFARPMHLRLEKANLADVLDRAAKELGQHHPPFDITVYKNYSPDIPSVEMDTEWMERVFYNLLLNAAQATAPGGAVTIKTRLVDSQAEICVIDRGSGIDAKHLENIFNPFFTTKSGGVGLGLAIVSKIVDEHQGTIGVESELGKGSVFRVFLPLNAGS